MQPCITNLANRGTRAVLAESRLATDDLLEVSVSSLAGREHRLFPLGAQELSVGRSSACDVVLASDSVSRKHVLIRRTKTGLSLRDVSSHGTMVDGVSLKGETCLVGTEVTLGVGPFVLALKLTSRAGAEAAPEPGPTLPPKSEVTRELRKALRNRVVESLDLASFDRSKLEPEKVRPLVEAALERAASELAEVLPTGAALQALLLELRHEVLGLGALEPLLDDPKVSEIMVVDAETIYVERAGCVELSNARFTDDDAVRSVLERIVTPLGRRIDVSNPMVDARLPDGSRVNAIIPPLALKGPAITIRRFPKRPLELAALLEVGAMTDEMLAFLQSCVRVRVNTVIAGGTGSGKTTLLNALSAAIPEGERIVTIEDAAELRLMQRHVVSLESRPPNMEGQGAVTIRDLVRNALRMRPDRIIVGECRGGEALDMLQAMNTGHDGAMTTTHANSPREATQRLETLCLMSGLDLPLSAVRRQIAASVDLIIQQARFSDGSRRITHITEVVGVGDDGEVELRDVFRFQRLGVGRDGHVEGNFVHCGTIPSFVERFIAQGEAGFGLERKA